MKVKKKIKSKIIATFVFTSCMFMFTACGVSNEGVSVSIGHTHEWSSTYERNASQHWKKCTSCDEITEKENHKFNVDTCTVCGYVDSNRTPAQKGAMSDYFSGVKATYTKENFFDFDNQSRDFKDFVDRQIDVLAQDILFRLNYIYGHDANNTGQSNSRAWYSSINLIDPCTKTEYKFNKTASVNSRNLLCTLDNTEISKILFDSEDPVKLVIVDIDNVADYQRSLLIKDTDNNCLASTEFLNLIGANSGRNMKLVSKVAGKRLDTDESKQWLISNLTSKDAKNALKLMIAQELTDAEGDDYDTLIGMIDNLGYKPNFSDKLINIINNKIIGADRINEDNGYYDILKNKYEGKITVDNVKSMDISSEYSDTNSPRLYKGYKVIVKELVESALGNKFSGTQVSLYPEFSKKAVDYTTDANGFSETLNYETITLLARENTPYTKFVLKIQGSNITGSATLEYQVIVNGESVGTKQNITLTNDSQELEISIAKTGTFGSFDGTIDVDKNTKIFENTQVDDRNTNNYITIEFANASGAKFVVTFDGYFNK